MSAADEFTAEEMAVEMDRAAVRALVDALPRCAQPMIGTEDDDQCEHPATVRAYLDRGGRLQCDEHASDADQNDVAALPYASALRVLLDRMKEWTS